MKKMKMKSTIEADKDTITEEELLESSLGRIMFSLGLEVMNAGMKKDADKLKKIQAVHEALSDIWPDEVKQIHETVARESKEG